MSPEHEKSISGSMDTTERTQVDESAQGKSTGIGLPAHVKGTEAPAKIPLQAANHLQDPL